MHVANSAAGSAGLLHSDDGSTEIFRNFELRKGSPTVFDQHLDRNLYDARGGYRGS